MSLRGLKIILQATVCAILLAAPAGATTLNPGDTFFVGATHTDAPNTTPGTFFTDTYLFSIPSVPLGTVTISGTGIVGNIGSLTLVWLDSLSNVVSSALVVTNPNGSSTLTDTLAYAFTVAGDYYLKVTGFAGVGSAQGGSYEVAISTTPIPPALLLFGSALAGLGFLGRRSRRSTAAGPLA
jgi:hypothetical protein